MRLGLVSDLHNNVVGLRAALDRMGDVDEVLCLGDVVDEHRFSNDVVAELRDGAIRCVLGNHDLGLLRNTRASGADHVDPALLAHLGSRPLLIEATVSGKRLVATHASPLAPHTQYVHAGSAHLARLAEVDADFVLIGHTHAQMATRVGRALVVNPGSAGKATDPRNGKRLSFAVLDTSTDEVTFEDYVVEDGEGLAS